MSDYVTVSTKVRRELKEEPERLGVKISEVLRRALEKEVRNVSSRNLSKSSVKLARLLKRSTSIVW